MDYSNVFYQLGKISHYSFAFLLLFIITPGILFKSNYDKWGERVVSKYMTMVFTVIISGYLLVITKLFEFISISILLSILLIMKYWDYIRTINKKPTITYLMKSLFDLFEGLHFINATIIKRWLSVNFILLRVHIKEKYKFEHCVEFFLFFIILLIAFYIRFYDSFTNAAPPLSDSYVTLAWMKYIDSRQLFHDGIYPQGFHIYLATLFKFAAIDTIFVLRYTGPLNAIFITFGIYFVVRKFTKNGIGALVAALLYGCLLSFIQWFPSERQVGTNSQEFAFVFIFPVIYFLINYCLSQKKHDLKNGILGTAIIGLVHSFAFMFIGLLIGILIICYVIQMKRISIVGRNLVIFPLLTVVLSILPFGIGILIGKKFHSSSVEYLLSNNNHQVLPHLVWVDFVALVCLFILLILLIFKRITDKEWFINLFTFLAGLITFCIYYFGGTLTNSVLVSSRSLELWGLMVPFVIGMCSSTVTNMFPYRLSKTTYTVFTLVTILLLFLLRPAPIIAYKLEHNANIEQYLKIAKDFRPKTWLMVSNDEGYSVVLGAGFHMHLHDFIEEFDSSKQALTRNGDKRPDRSLPPNIFILKEKHIFKVSNTNSVYSLLEPKYIQREKDYNELDKWIKKHDAWIKGHDAAWINKHKANIQIYYEDSNIIIYKIFSIASEKALEKD